MKKIFLSLIIICTILVGFVYFSLCANAENLKTIEHNGKYGFVNDKGKLVIDTKYDSARDFHEGLAAVLSDDNWEYINKKGKVIIKPNVLYDRVGDFKEGRAYVVHSVEKKNYDDGYTYVYNYIAYINKRGKIVIPFFEGGSYFYNFSNGLVAKQYGDSTYCSYMDKNGKIILDSDYFEKTGWKNTRDAGCHSFSENLLRVYKYTNNKYKTRLSAFMNKKGEIVYSRKFDVPEDEEEGSCDFDSFNEGMAGFRINWKYGFINKNFEEVIPPIYDFAYGFKDGLARVEKDGKWFYIDKQGNFVKEYKPEY